MELDMRTVPPRQRAKGSGAMRSKVVEWPRATGSYDMARGTTATKWKKRPSENGIGLRDWRELPRLPAGCLVPGAPHLCRSVA